jgi:hypothetical protein
MKDCLKVLVFLFYCSITKCVLLEIANTDNSVKHTSGQVFRNKKHHIASNMHDCITGKILR